MPSERQTPRVEWVAALFLASGAALLVYILAGVSLRWTFLTLVLAAAAVVVFALRKMPAPRRRRILRRIAIGAVIGLVATVAYDLVRLGLVEFAGLRIDPIEAWRLFGVALVGQPEPAPLVMVIGTLFHLCNGVAFGVAYTVAFGRRGPWAGIAWAFVLETAMVSVYPGWLELKALDEFLSVSVAGHIAYGVVLGVGARALLNSNRWGEHDDNLTSDTAPEPAGADR